ncbi:MAG: TIM barrel protein [Candidatus Thorarchaeota archaeon]|nr:TIM barrel protein [Candidatus Thorarchaeota archaeon]NIW13449.1 TIM barrel protein [Candidatus Thorarchaeota archaeon]
MISKEDEHQMNLLLAKAFQIASKSEIEDVSFHPPVLAENTKSSRDTSKQYLRSVIAHWLPRFQEKQITLSLETHVTPQYFIFTGLQDYTQFVSEFMELGVLIDFSHNFYDGYSVNEILSSLSGYKITGLHLSDAIVDAKLEEGLHLPVGAGNVDFKQIIRYFKEESNCYAALEIHGTSEDIRKSIKIIEGLMMEV